MNMTTFLPPSVDDHLDRRPRRRGGIRVHHPVVTVFTSASNTASRMRATARCSSLSAAVGPNGRVPVFPGPLGISTRRTGGIL